MAAIQKGSLNGMQAAFGPDYFTSNVTMPNFIPSCHSLLPHKLNPNYGCQTLQFVITVWNYWQGNLTLISLLTPDIYKEFIPHYFSADAFSQSFTYSQ